MGTGSSDVSQKPISKVGSRQMSLQELQWWIGKATAGPLRLGCRADAHRSLRFPSTARLRSEVIRTRGKAIDGIKDEVRMIEV